MELDTGATEYCEALIRWHRPGVGLVPPDEFIPLPKRPASSSTSAPGCCGAPFRSAQRGSRSLLGSEPSINVSVHQFRNGDLTELVRAALDESALPANLVILEITESEMLEESEWNLAVLERIRELGVRLALDDFGPGDSALTHLRRLPIETDRSFLQRLETEADLPTFRAIVALAHPGPGVPDLRTITPKDRSAEGTAPRR